MATILIVDDRFINREFLTTLFTYSNHQTLEAANGEVALEIIKKKSPDLIITDILMPTMDGYELAQNLRSDPELAKIPIIFYTATYRLDEAKQLGNACGVKYVLSKPSEPQLIIKTVNKALGMAEEGALKITSPNKSIIEPVSESLEITEIGNRLSAYIGDIENAKDAFNSLIKKTRELADERENLIKISEKFAISITSLRKLSSRLVTLNEFNLDLISVHDSKELLKLFYQGIQKIIGADYCVLVIIQDESKKIKYSFVSGTDFVDNTKIIPNIKNGLINKLLETRKIVLINSLEDHVIEFPDNHPVIETFLGGPIISAGRLYGFIYLANKKDKTEFNENDCSMVNTLISEMGVLYENIELYDLIQKHAAKLQISISKRKKTEEKLIKSEELFRQFSENIKDVFWKMNPEMDKLLYISPAYEEIWGRTCDNLYKNPYERLDSVLEGDKEEIHLFFNKLRIQNASVEYRIMHSDGTIKYIIEKGFHVKDENGKLINIIGIAADMTEFNQLKSQFHLDDKLKMVGTLAAGIAHEINNPIAWILGNLSILKKTFPQLI
jgi:PAS domain S-box-containing protein